MVEFGNDAPTETIDWVLSKLTSPPNNGGGQLLAKTTNINSNGKKVCQLKTKSKISCSRFFVECPNENIPSVVAKSKFS